MKTQFNYIIIEDTDLLAVGLEPILSTRPDLTLIKKFSNLKDSFQYLIKERPIKVDIAFLHHSHLIKSDKALLFLAALKNVLDTPKIIFITGYDYLFSDIFYYKSFLSGYIKQPIEYHKINTAIENTITELTKEESIKLPSIDRDYFFIKVENKVVKIYLDEITYCESNNNKVKIFTLTGSYETRTTLKYLLQKYLHVPQIIRVHDSFIINLDFLKSHAKNFTSIDLKYQDMIKFHEVPIPIGKKYREQFKVLFEEVN